MIRRLLGVAGFVLLLIALIWLSDRVTLQGERTIYTVVCESGTWQGSHCTGTLASSDRYAFRVSPRRHEVIYWIRASDKPSGKYSDCKVVDRDNWSCTVPPDQPVSVAWIPKHPVAINRVFFLR